MTAVLTVGGLAFDATAVEPKRIEVTHHDVVLRHLPRQLDGFTIAQLSDLHRSIIVPDSLIESAVRSTNKYSPDVVVLTGDFVSRNPNNAPPCAEMLSSLRPKLQTYAVLGNHDYWTDGRGVRKALEDKGIQVLKNENVTLRPGLTLLGLDDYWSGLPNPDKTWAGVEEDSAKVLITHNPNGVKLVSDRECLMMCGHTHGGQIQIPFIRRNRLPGLLHATYVQGWYTVGSVRMYVNRGIGMVAPPIRFMCSPEVTIFTLHSA